jgi:hypothetical protein
MRSIIPKILVSLLTFSVGVAAVAFWLIPRFIPSLSSTALPSSVSEEKEEYAVYSALLKELFIKDDTKLLVIQNRTQFSEYPYNYEGITSDERIRQMRKNYPSVSVDTLIDFDSKYMQPSELSPKFSLPIKYILIDKLPAERLLKDKSELEKGNNGTTTQTFFEKYPDAHGVISLSQIGFNQDRTEAFVCVVFKQCGVCGGGAQLLVVKKKGAWKVK